MTRILLSCNFVVDLCVGGDQRDRDRAKAQKKEAEKGKGKSQSKSEREKYFISYYPY